MGITSRSFQATGKTAAVSSREFPEMLNANAETTDTAAVPQGPVAPAIAPEQATSLEDLSVEVSATTFPSKPTTSSVPKI